MPRRIMPERKAERRRQNRAICTRRGSPKRRCDQARPAVAFAIRVILSAETPIMPPHSQPREGFDHNGLIVYAVQYQLETTPPSWLIVWLDEYGESAATLGALEHGAVANRHQSGVTRRLHPTGVGSDECRPASLRPRTDGR